MAIYFFLIIYFLFIIALVIKKKYKKPVKSVKTNLSQTKNKNLENKITKSFSTTMKEEELDEATFDYYVSPYGSDLNNGKNINQPFFLIQKAIDLAKPGERIFLLPGVYFQDIETVRDGMANNPIEITGSKEAIVKGGGKTNIFNIKHSYILIHNFTIDGKFKDKDSADSYRDKLIFITGQSYSNPTTGVVIKDMILKNARGECIRLKNFSVRNEVAYNTVNNCGIGDFVFKKSGKNGEGIYIGTAPEQLKSKNHTNEIDSSNGNWIHHNIINTQGNECVDIKEGSSDNLVEYNDCTGQKDPESGGLNTRGNHNIFRFNTITNNIGAGIRLGGDSEEDGINNLINGNVIIGNGGGGIKVQAYPQEAICENIIKNNNKGEIVGKFKDRVQNENKCF